MAFGAGDVCGCKNSVSTISTSGASGASRTLRTCRALRAFLAGACCQAECQDRYGGEQEQHFCMFLHTPNLS